MGYRDYVRAVRKYWWIVAVVFVLAMGAGAFFTLTTQKLYATTVTFFVKTPSDQISSAAQGDTFGQKRVNSYVQLASTDRLVQPVLKDTKLSMTAAQLAGGSGIADALNYANAAASICVQRMGAAPSMPTAVEVGLPSPWIVPANDR